MIQKNYNLSDYQMENSVATIIQELSEVVSAFNGTDRDRVQREKLSNLTGNAMEELEMWGHAVGHVAWLASTHDEADKNTTDALGIIGLMQGRLLTITKALDNLHWNVNHNFNKQTNSLNVDEVNS